MKRLLIFVFGLLAPPLTALAQSASDPNEGSKLVSLGNNAYRFTWWARAGVYYLLEVSPDLVNWAYVDLGGVVQGNGGLSPFINFNNVTGDRLFVRLNTDPFNTDTDGDKMSDGWEILYGMNARLADDPTLNPDGDEYTNLEESALGLDPHFDEYGNGQRTQIYTYDNASRITNVSSNRGESFIYDDEGNLTNSQ